MPAPRRIRGFTLIEMMVAVTVVIVLLLIAVPSFQTMRQRSAIRSASEQVLGVWNQSRIESAKRNTWVKFARQTSGTNYCVGAAVATSITDTTACNCFQADSTQTDFCNVTHWPHSNSATDQAEWRGVSLAAPTSATSLGTVLIEPKHAFLATGSTPGGMAFIGPPGPNQYKVYLQIDALGRGVLCQPTNAVHKLSDYGNRGCAP